MAMDKIILREVVSNKTENFQVFLAIGGLREERKKQLVNELFNKGIINFLKNKNGKPYLRDGPFFQYFSF